MSKLKDVIDQFNKYPDELKIGDLISEIEYISDGYISTDGKSTIRVYVKDLLNAHFIVRVSKGWYKRNEEIDEIPYMLGRELKELKKYETLEMMCSHGNILRESDALYFNYAEMKDLTARKFTDVCDKYGVDFSDSIHIHTVAIDVGSNGVVEVSYFIENEN